MESELVLYPLLSDFLSPIVVIFSRSASTQFLSFLQSAATASYTEVSWSSRSYRLEKRKAWTKKDQQKTSSRRWEKMNTKSKEIQRERGRERGRQSREKRNKSAKNEINDSPGQLWEVEKGRKGGKKLVMAGWMKQKRAEGFFLRYKKKWTFAHLLKRKIFSAIKTSELYKRRSRKKNRVSIDHEISKQKVLWHILLRWIAHEISSLLRLDESGAPIRSGRG